MAKNKENHPSRMNPSSVPSSKMPITMLNARSAGVEVLDCLNPDALDENDTYNPGSGDGDTV